MSPAFAKGRGQKYGSDKEGKVQRQAKKLTDNTMPPCLTAGVNKTFI